jgi:hypothetical protein
MLDPELVEDMNTLEKLDALDLLVIVTVSEEATVSLGVSSVSVIVLSSLEERDGVELFGLETTPELEAAEHLP